MAVGIVLILAFATLWLGSLVGIFYSFPFFDYILPDQSFLSILGVFNLVFIIGIPILSIILLIVRLVFGKRMSSFWRTGMMLFLSLNIVSLVFIGTTILQQFSNGDSTTETVNLELNQEKPMQLALADDRYEHVLFQMGRGVKFSEEALVCSQIVLDILPSPTDEVFYEKELFARGHTLDEAGRLARRIDYPLQWDENELTLPPNFIIPNGEKFRDQKVYLNIYLPKGQTIEFDESLKPFAWHVHWKRHIPFWNEYGKIWSMTEKGLRCQNCDENESFEESTVVIPDTTTIPRDSL